MSNEKSTLYSRGANYANTDFIPDNSFGIEFMDVRMWQQ